MLLVRLTAMDLRTISAASTDEQLRGVKALIETRIEEANTLKEFGKTPQVTQSGKYLWREVRDDLKAVLGDKLIVPPFPDRLWFVRINDAVKAFGMDKEYVTNLATYCAENLAPPYSMDFVVRQHSRILGGAFNKPSAVTKTSWVDNALPD